MRNVKDQMENSKPAVIRLLRAKKSSFGPSLILLLNCRVAQGCSEIQ